MHFEPRTCPTFYFIGVTTGQSSINAIFPRWMDILGRDVQLAGIDAPLHAPAETYRAIVEHIKHDPLVRGGLVTTHKIDLLEATRDLFDELDPNAELCGEVSAIVKRDGKLIGYAKDPISSGQTWEHFVPAGHFGRTGAEVLCFGSGGAAVATTVYLAGAADRPKHVTLVDVSRERLEHARHIHQQLRTDIQFHYGLNADPYQNDILMSDLPAASVVINGTGMGKDLSGSPITPAGLFPQNGLVWEFNYRGELTFLKQAQQQATMHSLTIEDGWVYFLNGWTQVVAEVLGFALTPELFEQMDAAAKSQ
ncbi:MAG: shikimate dehydrogenase [Chloroflexi bacterium]|nr:shikimate dehydrogenase [Chloroflexota bacterium]MCC6895750.1 shikimate dehydrogenase [Anaerolineae bacterium]